MIERLIRNPAFRVFFPPLAGTVFIAIFVSLGIWQLDRAAEKKTLLARFDGGTATDSDYAQVNDYTAHAMFERIRIAGNFMPERQVLIDNIVQDGRPGYYVITPFKPQRVGPLLLVNRGWVPKQMSAATLPDVSVDSEFRTARGLAGRLPRVAIRPGEAFAGAEGWPRVAVYPQLEEVARELDAAVAPLVLLLGENEADGFQRRWQPNVSGPSTHYGYAFQWFAMAATVVALLLWNLKKRSRNV